MHVNRNSMHCVNDSGKGSMSRKVASMACLGAVKESAIGYSRKSTPCVSMFPRDSVGYRLSAEDIDDANGWGYFADFEEPKLFECRTSTSSQTSYSSGDMDLSNCSDHSTSFMISDCKIHPLENTLEVDEEVCTVRKLQNCTQRFKTFTCCGRVQRSTNRIGQDWLRKQFSWQSGMNATLQARISVPNFRIVERNDRSGRHAEYEINLRLDDVTISSCWKRHSSIERYMNRLKDKSLFPQTYRAWTLVQNSTKWFRNLDISYLHKKCIMMERFIHALLMESPSPDIILDFLLHQ